MSTAPTVNGVKSWKNPMIGTLGFYTSNCVDDRGFFQFGDARFKILMRTKLSQNNERVYYIKILHKLSNNQACTYVKYKRPFLLNGLFNDGFLTKRGVPYIYLKQMFDTNLEAQTEIKRAALHKLFLKLNPKIVGTGEYVMFVPEMLSDSNQLDRNRLGIFMQGLKDLLQEDLDWDKLKDREPLFKAFTRLNEVNEKEGNKIRTYDQHLYTNPFVSTSDKNNVRFLKHHPDRTEEGAMDIINTIDRNLSGIQLDYNAVINPSTSQSGGKQFKKTSNKVQTAKGLRCVYVGPRGGRYVKESGKYVRLKSA